MSNVLTDFSKTAATSSHRASARHSAPCMLQHAFRSRTRGPLPIPRSPLRALSKPANVQASTDPCVADQGFLGSFDATTDSCRGLVAPSEQKSGAEYFSNPNIPIPIEPAGTCRTQVASSRENLPGLKKSRERGFSGIPERGYGSRGYNLVSNAQRRAKDTRTFRLPSPPAADETGGRTGLLEEHVPDSYRMSNAELGEILKTTLAVPVPFRRSGKPRLVDPVTPKELVLRLRQALTFSPFPSLSRLIGYHSAHRSLHSASSYNVLVELAIRHTSYTVASHLLKRMEAENIEPNRHSKLLYVRLLARTGRWNRAWIFIRQEQLFDDEKNQLSLWLEVLGRKEPEEFCTDKASVGYAKRPGREMERLRNASDIHRMRAQIAVSQAQDYRPRILPSVLSRLPTNVRPPLRFIQLGVRYLLQNSQVEAARAVTLEWISRLREPFSTRRRRRCLEILHLHLGYSATGLRAHFASRDFVRKFLSLQPHLRPTSSTLYLLLRSLKGAKGNTTFCALQLVNAFRKKWGPAMIDRRVRRRIVTIAVEEGRVKVAEKWVMMERGCSGGRERADVQEQAIGVGRAMLPRRIRRTGFRKMMRSKCCEDRLWRWAKRRLWRREH